MKRGICSSASILRGSDCFDSAPAQDRKRDRQWQEPARVERSTIPGLLGIAGCGWNTADSQRARSTAWKALRTQHRTRSFRLTNHIVSERQCQQLKMEIPAKTVCYGGNLK